MYWIILLIGLVTVVAQCASASRKPYTAAAYEHARFGTHEDPPKLVKKTNLDAYIKAASVAKSKGADIIVYPEYGIFLPGNRTHLKHFLEEVPDPQKFRVNPCENKEDYLKRPILLTLSCIAKNNSIVVVANTGEIKPCSGELDCPKDNAFHYNINVVFNKDGTMLLRYRKEHLYFELGMDLPKGPQNYTFVTDFGTFATFICFDLAFERVSQVSKWPQVDGIMFSTMWVERPPQFGSVPYFQSWAIGNNITLVAANVQMPDALAVGSGIFLGQNGVLDYTYSPDGISKLVIVKIPVNEEQPVKYLIAVTPSRVWDFEETGDSVPNTCSRHRLNSTGDRSSQYRCYDEITTNYTMVKLTNRSGYKEVCNNGMCCSVNYFAKNMTEDFYLGVSNGTVNLFNRYYLCEENCFLARCDPFKNQSCYIFPSRANTLFHHVELKANFTTEYIYPSVVSSKMRLVPLTEWNYNTVQKSGSYESSINFHSKEGEQLLNVGFKSRCFQRDPPYIR